MSRARHHRWLWLAIVVAMFAGACGGEDEPTTTEAGEDTTTTTTTVAEPVEIRWFVGLGTGSSPEQQEVQQAVVDRFNASHPNIIVTLDVVDHDSSTDILSTQIAANDAPDVIGPVGREGANAFDGLYLPIEDLVTEMGADLSVWPDAAIDNFREDGVLYGLPFASYPSELWFNKDLFDAADLPYPPMAYGEKYGVGTDYEGDWTFEKLEEIALLLTKDSAGKNASEAGFNAANAVQWGFVWQWTDRPFQQGQYWGSGYPMADDGTASIPTTWADEWKWYYDAIWEKGFSPSKEQLDSALLAGNAFKSGNVAMGITHSWFTCCMADDTTGEGYTWFDLAAIPSHNGVVTANMHGDSFRIMASTEHPQAAFEFLWYLVNSEDTGDLLVIYGAQPALLSLKEEVFSALDEKYPQGLNWDVVLEGAEYADVPSHELNLPGWAAYVTRMNELLSAMQTESDLDMDAVITELEADLSQIFAENAE